MRFTHVIPIIRRQLSKLEYILKKRTIRIETHSKELQVSFLLPNNKSQSSPTISAEANITLTNVPFASKKQYYVSSSVVACNPKTPSSTSKISNSLKIRCCNSSTIYLTKRAIGQIFFYSSSSDSYLLLRSKCLLLCSSFSLLLCFTFSPSFVVLSQPIYNV